MIQNLDYNIITTNQQHRKKVKTIINRQQKKKNKNLVNFESISYIQKKYLKIKQNVERKVKLTKKKDSNYWRQLKRKEKKRFVKNFWILANLIKTALTLIKDPKKKEDILKRYPKIKLKIKIKNQTENQKFVLNLLKKQQFLKRKRFSLLTLHKRQKLNINNFELFWDFFESRKIKSKGFCISVKRHPNKIYSLKRVIRFFYGYLKNSVFKKAFLKAKNAKNKFISFYNILENRLVVTLFRMNFVLNIIQAKQFIRHGFIFVNDKRIVFPNYKIVSGDVVTINPKCFYKSVLESKNKFDFLKLISEEIISHLYVKFRIFSGIVLYDLKHNYNLLIKQYPNIFFGKEDSDIPYINKKNIKNEKNFKIFADSIKNSITLKKKKENPFLTHLKDNFLLKNQYLSEENQSIMLSYFLKY